MKPSPSSSTRNVRVLRWTARIFSALFIVLSLLTLFPFVGEVLSEDSLNDLQSPLVLTGFWLLGLALAWKWEALGGSIALAAFLVLIFMYPGLIMNFLPYLLTANLEAAMPGVPIPLLALSLLPVPLLAPMFLACWWIDIKQNRQKIV